VYVLSAIAFLVALGFGMVIPVIPVLARTFGVTAAAAGAVVAAFALMRLVSAPVAGKLVNRVGERLILGVGVTIVAASSGAAGLSQTYGQLLVFRGLGGVGSAMFTVSAAALLIRSVPDALRGRATGVFGAGFLLGGVVGPLFGAVLAVISLRAPFFGYALVLFAAGAVGLALLPRHQAEGSAAEVTPDPAERSVRGVERFRHAIRLPAYRTALVVSFAAGFTLFGVRSATVPLFVTESLGQAASLVGIGLLLAAVANGVALYPVGRVADLRGRRPALIVGATVSALGMALLAGAGSVALFLVAMIVTGLGSSALHVVPPALVGDVAGGRSATLVAGYQMAGDVGAIVGPLLAGWLVDASGYPAAFGMTAAVLCIAALVGALSPETLRTPEAQRPAQPVSPG
jgi:MFS family permease